MKAEGVAVGGRWLSEKNGCWVVCVVLEHPPPRPHLTPTVKFRLMGRCLMRETGMLCCSGVLSVCLFFCVDVCVPREP